MRFAAIGCAWLLVTGCGAAEVVSEPVPDSGSIFDATVGDAASPEPSPDAAHPGRDAGGLGDAAEPDASAGADASTPEPCAPGVTCVERFPFADDRDTSTSSSRRFERYACAPDIDEGGAEVVYRVAVPQAGFLSAAVSEAAGVDVDVHILGSLDAAACLDRGNFDARADVGPGFAYVVVDTYVAGGVEHSGAYRLDIGFVAPSEGSCAMESGEMPRVGDGGDHLAMPATGAVVREAHLVTQEEPPPYPATQTEFLERHYALSRGRSGLVMHRREPWAPLEGGTFYGCGIGSPALFPVLDEAWYVNMYWTSAARPPRGTRMLLRVPGTDRAVVVAAGYETGPGDLGKVGGTPEETHFYLGATQPWTLGIASDQSIPLGPRTCR